MKRREREIATVRARERDVIIISNTPASGRREKGQERVGQRCRWAFIGCQRRRTTGQRETRRERMCNKQKKETAKERQRLHTIDIQKDR